MPCEDKLFDKRKHNFQVTDMLDQASWIPKQIAEGEYGEVPYEIAQRLTKVRELVKEAMNEYRLAMEAMPLVEYVTTARFIAK